MSLASTHRHLKVFGKDTKTCIEANAIVARFALLVLVAASRGCFWLDFWLQELVLTIYTLASSLPSALCSGRTAGELTSHGEPLHGLPPGDW